MAMTQFKRCKLAVLVLAGASLGLGGCGTDVQFDAPVLEAVGINLTAKQKDEDIPERAGIVIPPSTENLPKPGEQQTAAANRQEAWPEDPDQIKARKEAEAEKAREEYCREGDWSSDAGIEEFEKNMGRKQRCQSKLGKALSEAVGGGEATAAEQ